MRFRSEIGNRQSANLREPPCIMDWGTERPPSLEEVTCRVDAHTDPAEVGQHEPLLRLSDHSCSLRRADAHRPKDIPNRLCRLVLHKSARGMRGILYRPIGGNQAEGKRERSGGRGNARRRTVCAPADPQAAGAVAGAPEHPKRVRPGTIRALTPPRDGHLPSGKYLSHVVQNLLAMLGIG